MYRINENYLNLQDNYLFSTIAKKVENYQKKNLEAKIIKLGIGDVTLPIPNCVIEKMKKACEEMGNKNTFRGYGPEKGYEFLREKIVKNDYLSRGVKLEKDEIFISDGAKSDTGNITEILHKDCKIAIEDPVYPVYLDTNVMDGRSGKFNEKMRQYENIIYMPCIEENNFMPEIPTKVPDVIYLCSPNNPTGTVLTEKELKKWVNFAKENKSIILFDSAYEAYISDEKIPHSIYEIEGAKEVAIEFRSFSKTAGFTGIRCSYTVVPKELVGYTKTGENVNMNELWNRRQCTKFNGVPYIVQRAAEETYTKEGKKGIKENINYYMNNAQILKQGLKEAGYVVYGGKNAPYIWLATPDDLSSWEFFDYLLEQKSIVGTPGSGFGVSGEGFFRLSAFGSREDTIEAVKRLKCNSLKE